MDERKHHSSGAYRANSGGATVGDSRGGGGQRYVGGRNGGRGGDHRKPKERDGREQRARNTRGRVSGAGQVLSNAVDFNSVNMYIC